MACGLDALGVDRGRAPVHVDLDLDLGGDERVELGGRVVDSLAFVQWMVRLEEQLDVGIVDFADSDRARTLGQLATTVLQDADPSRVRAFCERWAPSPRSAA